MDGRSTRPRGVLAALLAATSTTALDPELLPAASSCSGTEHDHMLLLSTSP
eukprot:CAMPEP_0202864704 /NCGR_PEP_ID=MMETSP1391-20130828/4836_1 /ASSEMBLY_ACC=CAM_ASM_000867 /TAXON_ID=1034604 /ORGANISM="Chlamydomonas leiostraca, Strain SAG 11-49" /LENGTH=50 /DNA_ID=CAMNT_0049544473 /DNA_START=675 /DNA_END=827 /DNA_ORIENTATION=-